MRSPALSEHYPRIRRSGVFDTGSFLRIRESIGITFYMRRNHQEVAPAVLRALELYRHAIAPHALGEYPDPVSECWQPLDDKGWAFIHEEFTQPGTRLWQCESASATTGDEFIYSGQSGGREQDQILPAYRELARVLKPWKYEERFRFRGFSDEDMRRWQRRFLD